MTETYVTEQLEARVVRNAGRVIVPALIVAAIGLAGFILDLFLDPQRAMYSYLAAFAAAVAMPLGALFMLMIAHVTGAKWFVVIRRVAETIAGTLPFFAVLIIPVLVGLGVIYAWVPPVPLPPHEAEVVARKAAYLNVPFFIGRTVLYFAVWITLALALQRWSLRQDRDPDDAPLQRPVMISGPGIAAAALTVSFAAIDWLMSLDPTWVSSVFGAYWFSVTMYAGLPAILLVTFALQRGGVLEAEVAGGHYHALGRLMLAFTLLWVYLAYSQGFLIYIADLPHEVTWYLDRTAGGWDAIFWLLVFGHFFVPFFALLSYRLKRSARWMAALAAWMLLMHYVETFWVVMPALRPGDFSPSWVDPATVIFVLGSAIAFGAWRLSGESAVPWRDPRIASSIQYRRE